MRQVEVGVSCQKLIANSGIVFGTSGARGLVRDFSTDVCGAFTQSFIAVLSEKNSVTELAVGVDNRPSSPAMAAACIGMLNALGINVHYFGVLPTPALAFYALKNRMPAIMITGSHIPFDRNGIKFYRADGEITKEDELAILQQSLPLVEFEPTLPPVDTIAAEAYIKRYTDFFPNNLLINKHIGVYEHSSAGRELYYRIFTSLGAKVTRLEPSDVFVPIDTEAVSLDDQQRALKWSQLYGFDAIFSTDGDGDRPLIADDHGHWLRGDLLGLLTAKSLGIEALSVPVNSNSAIDLVGLFKKVIRTKIGSPYVIAAFTELSGYKSYAGFEANGGFILGSEISNLNSDLSPLPTRDAVLPMLALMGLCSDKPISKLLTDLPERVTTSGRIQNFPVELSKSLLEGVLSNPNAFLRQLPISNAPSLQVESINAADGVRLLLNNSDIIHLRPSGNAPELRCYIESNNQANADAMLKACSSSVTEYLCRATQTPDGLTAVKVFN